MKKASIIIPCYNDATFLNEAILSACNQTYPNFEIILVDDGSTDEKTIDLINGLNIKNLKKFRIENSGPAYARNYGIHQAEGHYILPLDSDDLIEKSYLEKCIKIFENDGDVGIVYCKAKLIGQINNNWDLPNYSLSTMLVDNLIFVTSCFKKEDWERVGGFDISFKDGLEDYDFWLKIIELGKKVERIEEILFYYRIREGSRTKKFIEDKKLMFYYDNILHKHEILYKENCINVIKEMRKLIIEYKIYGIRTEKSIDDYTTRFLLKEIIKRKIPILLKLRNKLKQIYKLIKERFLFLTNHYNNYEFIKSMNINYYTEYKKYSNFIDDNTKIVAFYLPQFHRTKENDRWWGTGFTEWDNVKKAKKLFWGHFQPKKPIKDIGYYNLTNPETIKFQARLMKNYGINGVAIYYYNFNGEKILTKPIEIIYNDKSIDINYCLFWANENWTKIWTGDENTILLEQKYEENTEYQLVDDIHKYLEDNRYIRLDGKPVFIIYKILNIPNPKIFIDKLRQYAQERYKTDLYIIGCIHEYRENNKYNFDEKAIGLDALVEFGPLYLYKNSKTYEKNNIKHNLLDYRSQVWNAINNYSCIKDRVIFPTVYNGFDNSPRRPKGGSYITINFSVYRFYYWLINAIDFVNKKYKQKVVFIHSWNEWAEGTAIEPTEKYGYTLLDMIAKSKGGIELTKPSSNNKTTKKTEQRIIVMFHCYYLDLAEKYITTCDNIERKYDMIITTDKEEKKDSIEKLINKKRKYLSKYSIITVPNRGRDIAPFFIELNKVRQDYDIGLHIHTKKSSYNKNLELWADDIISKLLPKGEKMEKILNMLQEDKVGIIIPELYREILPYIDLGDNYQNIKKILNRIRIREKYFWEEFYDFPAGSMFWFKVECLQDIFTLNLDYNDFEEETGHVDGTLAHALERVICVCAKHANYLIKKV